MASVAKEWREIPGRYNLIGSECKNCGKIYFPKRSLCPVCRRQSLGKMADRSICRKGEIYTFTVIYDAPDCNNRLKPYAAAMIRTDDGVMVTGQIADADLNEIKIGMRVRAVLRKLDSDGASGVIHYGFKFVPDE